MPLGYKEVVQRLGEAGHDTGKGLKRPVLLYDVQQPVGKRRPEMGSLRENKKVGVHSHIFIFSPKIKI